LVLCLQTACGPSAFAASIELAGAEPNDRRLVREIGHRDLMERTFPSAHRNSSSRLQHRPERSWSDMIARRTLLPGQPMPMKSVEKPVLVRRGEPARLVFQRARTGHHHAGRGPAERRRRQFRARSKHRQRFGRVRKSSGRRHDPRGELIDDPHIHLPVGGFDWLVPATAMVRIKDIASVAGCA
jgi:hypothetical protein